MHVVLYGELSTSSYDNHEESFSKAYPSTVVLPYFSETGIVMVICRYKPWISQNNLCFYDLIVK